MKKTILLCAVIFLLSQSVFAQSETKMAFGLGPEWNMNSRDNFAGGASLSFDYNLFRSFAAGLSFTASNNFDGITVLEPSALFRWYFLGRGHEGLFAQAEAGVFVVLEDGDTTPLFLGGLRAGMRLPIGRFYMEPFGRIGYPFAFGVGAMAGVNF